ncbi:hypothetical protein TNCV_3820491 [Trichonephila clavipes]|nr:hypothetical protein TNCV_3820491 [Trichonephila clavipes]
MADSVGEEYQVVGSTPAHVGGFSRSRKSTASMWYDHAAFQRCLDGMFGLDVLGKIKFLEQVRIVRAQMPPSGEETSQNYLRQLVSPIWYHTKK